jgi:hypothetical protein
LLLNEDDAVWVSEEVCTTNYSNSLPPSSLV